MQKTRFRLIREEDINLDMELYLREYNNGYMPYCIQDILYNPNSPREDKISSFILKSKIVTMFYNENIKAYMPLLSSVTILIEMFFDMVYVKE